MKNKYVVNGDVTTLFIERRDGQALECFIDTEDLERVKSLNSKWHVKKANDDYFYAIGYIYEKTKVDYYFKIHHFIVGFPINDMVVDHINGNPLDNRKSNLRIITKAQNQQNRRKAAKHSFSGIRGVSWDSTVHLWKAKITVDKKVVYLGGFKDPVEAGRVAADARSKYMPYSIEALPSKQDGFFAVGG